MSPVEQFIADDRLGTLVLFAQGSALLGLVVLGLYAYAWLADRRAR